MVTKQQFELIQKYLELSRERQKCCHEERRASERGTDLYHEMEDISKRLVEAIGPNVILEHEGIIYHVYDGKASINIVQKLEQFSTVKNY